MTDEEHIGATGPQGEPGPAGPQGEPGPPAPVPLEEPVPFGYRHIAAFIRNHPSLKRPSSVTIVVLMAIVIGFGFLHFSDAAATRKVTAAHNAEACTLRSLIDGLRGRAVQASVDQAASAASRKRALDSLPGYDTLLAGQVTQPRNLDCKVLLAKLAAKRKADDAARVSAAKKTVAQ